MVDSTKFSAVFVFALFFFCFWVWKHCFTRNNTTKTTKNPKRFYKKRKEMWVTIFRLIKKTTFETAGWTVLRYVDSFSNWCTLSTSGLKILKSELFSYIKCIHTRNEFLFLLFWSSKCTRHTHFFPFFSSICRKTHAWLHCIVVVVFAAAAVCVCFCVLLQQLNPFGLIACMSKMWICIHAF